MRAASLALIAVAAGCAREAKVTHLDVHVEFAAAVVVDQLRFVVTDGAGATLVDASRPEPASASPLPSGSGVAILLADARPVHVRVIGARDGVERFAGAADAQPVDGEAADVTVQLDQPLLVSISLSPPDPQIAVGTTVQLTATGDYGDLSTRDLTALADWSSSDDNIATVDNKGLVTARASGGGATVRATYQGVTGGTVVAVTAAKLTAITLTPTNPSVPVGAQRQFFATGVFSDQTTQDLTSSVTWTTDDPNVATAGNAPGQKGLVSTVLPGTTLVKATDAAGAVTGMTLLTVTAATLKQIAVTPAAPTIAKGTSLQLAATGTYSDNSTQDLTLQVSWTSSDMTVATVDGSGVVSAIGPGTADLTATSGMVSGVAHLKVTAATLTAIAVEPANPTLAKGTTQQLAAIGTFSDQTTQDLTDAVDWSSSDKNVASVAQGGLASAVNPGMATVTARDPQSGVMGATSLTVSAATLKAIVVTPPNPQVAKGTMPQFTAIGTYSDNSTQDLTAQAAWASSDGNVATVSNAMGSAGKATTVAVGMTTISATVGNVGGSTVMTVTAATLQSIAVSPLAPSVAAGSTVQFAAVGTYSDNSTQDLTAQATWASSDGNVASVSNAMGSAGLASTAAPGKTTISATAGNVTGSTALTVTAATLKSIDVTPANPSVAKGSSQQFTATGTYSDNSTLDLTTQVTWASSDKNVATVSNAMGSAGLASTASAGTASISATLGNVTGATTLTVTAAVLQSITVAPGMATIAKGTQQAFTATGHYSDQSTQDLTTQVTWSSSDGNVASVTNGVATGVGVGNATIGAAKGNVSGSASLTVSAATLQSIAVAPQTATIAKGTRQQFTATGKYSDNSTQDITTQVTWSSSDGNIASVSNAMGSNGSTTGVAVGLATITAAKGMVSGSAALQVTNAALVSIDVTPANAVLGNLATQQYHATGHYSDQSLQDLTTQVTWASSNSGLISISNSNGSQGKASTALLGSGSATISATHASGIVGSTGVTVN